MKCVVVTKSTLGYDVSVGQPTDSRGGSPLNEHGATEHSAMRPRLRSRQWLWISCLALLMLAIAGAGSSQADDPPGDDGPTPNRPTASPEGSASETKAGDGNSRAKAEDGNTSSSTRKLPEQHQRWYEDVDMLISEVEREVFLSLIESYQREHFIERFWKVRDPYPSTPRNEFQDLWEARVREARETLQDEQDMTSARARMILLFGPPTTRSPLFCTELLQPLELWEYQKGSELVNGYFTLIFYGFKGRPWRGPKEQWEPNDGLRPLVTDVRLATASDVEIARQISRDCSRGDVILSAVSQSLDISRLRDSATLVPKVNDEWVQTFRARSTALDADDTEIGGKLDISFPGRHQSRTVVQGLVTLDRKDLEYAELGPHRAYHLLVDGEILRQGELFEHFRYRFSLPADLPGDEIPVVVQRYLRPGEYEIILKVENAPANRVYRRQETLQVPRVKHRPDPPPTVVAPAGSGQVVPALTDADGKPRSSITQRLVEANASISTGDHTIKILPLPNTLTVGKLRVKARVRGEGIAKVAFELNDRPVMRKSSPPYSVELDLGDKPDFHTLRVFALDSEGKTLATDEMLINSGPHSFSVRLLEPQSGKHYADSVRAHAEVEVPEGEKLDKVELYLEETLIATLFQPPFEQPILLPGTQGMSYVRAVAYLKGGNTTETVQFINAPDFVDELKVQFVELYTTVQDRTGDLVEDLQASELTVLEDGKPQQIRRFESMRDLPIRAGLVIDTSLSMLTNLREVKKAAYQFFEDVLTPKDRAALITFADEPHLGVRFTSNKEVLAGGLAELTAEGETALYDSIIFSLHYFSGLSGKRAIIVLTDGEDSSSTYTYEEAVEFARRTGVAVYVIGLNLASKNTDIRLRMRGLAAETGGELFFIDRASQLTRIYKIIQEELRSQYLVAYQSSVEDGDDAFRQVEVQVLRKGLEAKTIRGYYP